MSYTMLDFPLWPESLSLPIGMPFMVVPDTLTRMVDNHTPLLPISCGTNAELKGFNSTLGILNGKQNWRVEQESTISSTPMVLALNKSPFINEHYPRAPSPLLSLLSRLLVAFQRHLGDFVHVSPMYLYIECRSCPHPPTVYNEAWQFLDQ